MPEEETAATKPPPPMEAEEQDATAVQSSTGEEEQEVAAATRPDPEDENSVGSKSVVENTETIQPVSEEMEAEPPVAEEDNAVTTRPVSGQENEVGSESREVEEETAATIQIVRKGKKKAKPTRPEQKEKENENEIEAEPVRLELPTGRVKKIMKLDRDINKVNSEALHLVACSTQLFLQFLAEGSADAAAEKKRKIIKLEHIRTAAKRHQATKDFLFDELPVASQPSDQKSADRSRSRPVAQTPAPAGSRQIDDFFRKPATEVLIQTEEA